MIRNTLIFLTILGWCAQAHADVRLFPSGLKLLDQGGPPAGLASITVEGARGEYEGFQVLIAAGATTVQQVNVALSPLTQANGQTLPASVAEFYVERYVTIDQGSVCAMLGNTLCDSFPQYLRKPGRYPEQLVPFVDPYSDAHPPVGAPFDVTPNSYAVVWVDLHVPNAPAGDYQGTVTVTSLGQPAESRPVTLHIWDFDMPTERHVATAYGFSDGAIRSYHGGPQGPDDANFARIHRNYELEVHRHRIDFTDYGPGLTWKFDAQGALLPVDYSAYDAYLAPRLDGSFFPDHAGINRWNVGMFGPGHGLMGLTEAQYGLAATDLAAHLQAKDWLKHAYLYSADEPWQPGHSGEIADIQQSVALLKNSAPAWIGHVLATSPWLPALDGAIDIWCPVTAMYGNGLWGDGVWADATRYADERKKGHELWFYVCNADFPPELGYDTDSPIGYEPRLLKWGAWAEGATGFLYWRMTYWQDPHPWDVLRNVNDFAIEFARHGDGILLFPGDHNGTTIGAGSPPEVHIDGPVVSYRMKQVRDGLEDWEMFLLADRLGAGAWAHTQVARAYRQFGGRLDESFDPTHPPWTLSLYDMEDARRQIAKKIEYLQHPSLYVDPEVTAAQADAGTSDDADAFFPRDYVDSAQPRAKSGCGAGRADASGLAALLCALVGLLWRRARQAPVSPRSAS